MLADNNTPLAALGFEQWHPDGRTMAAVVVRARLMLHADGNVTFADAQDLILADAFGTDPHRSSMTEVGDLVPFRPAADVTVRGSLHVSEPATVLTAGIMVDAQSAVLRATGPRQWHYDKRWRLGDPDKVTEVSLCYTLTTGGRIIGHPDGEVDARNPIGAGVIDPAFAPKSVALRAAQITSGDTELSADPDDTPPPAGFGAMSPWWQARACHAGTYDEEWQRTTHPRLPRNFDYRFYQAAHPGLIMPGYLYPGMPVQTFGLWPGGGAVNFILPDIVPVARFGFTDGREVAVRLHMDGLHLDLTGPQPCYDLTWRGWIEACPALYRADLDMMRWHEAAPLRLPVSCVDGLMEAPA